MYAEGMRKGEGEARRARAYKDNPCVQDLLTGGEHIDVYPLWGMGRCV